MKTSYPLLSLLLLASTTLVHAQTDKKELLEIKPVLLDTPNSKGATLGLEYKLAGDLLKKSLTTNDSGNAGLDTSASIGELRVSVLGQGTITVQKDSNPKDFLDFQLDAKYFLSTASSGTFSGGFFSKYEANQSLTNKQSVNGLRLTAGKLDFGARNAFFGLDLHYGQVTPKGDTLRKVALGNLRPYNRWDYEALYLLPMRWHAVTNLELNYRVFSETGAPLAVRNAGLATYTLATIRATLKNGMSLAYSYGKLPFDKTNDQIFTTGLSFGL
jgi:hypothetical protein